MQHYIRAKSFYTLREQSTQLFVQKPFSLWPINSESEHKLRSIIIGCFLRLDKLLDDARYLLMCERIVWLELEKLWINTNGPLASTNVNILMSVTILTILFEHSLKQIFYSSFFLTCVCSRSFAWCEPGYIR